MGKKILIVDDELLIRRVLAYLLQDNGYDVSVAQDGNEGLQMVNEVFPDLIFLDVMMPNKDGLEVCQEIRNNEKFKDTCILMLTASGEYVDNEKWASIGANGYIAKPFSPSKILETVKNLIG